MGPSTYGGCVQMDAGSVGVAAVWEDGPAGKRSAYAGPGGCYSGFPPVRTATQSCMVVDVHAIIFLRGCGNSEHVLHALDTVLQLV